MLSDPLSLDEAQALADADFEGLPREALVASLHYLAEQIVSLGELCQRMSPSAIPDQRMRAAQYRGDHPGYGLRPVYGFDSLCDYLEAVFYKLGVGGCGLRPDMNWKVYDELRRADPDWICWVEDCQLMAEFRTGTCIVHRDLRKDDA